jgi:hypothetical protein
MPLSSGYDGCRKRLWNFVKRLPNYKKLQRRRQTSSCSTRENLKSYRIKLMLKLYFVQNDVFTYCNITLGGGGDLDVIQWGKSFWIVFRCCSGMRSDFTSRKQFRRSIDCFTSREDSHLNHERIRTYPRMELFEQNQLYCCVKPSMCTHVANLEWIDVPIWNVRTLFLNTPWFVLPRTTVRWTWSLTDGFKERIHAV